MITTGTTQVGKLESGPSQNETIRELADSSAGIVKAQLIKYIHVI